MWRSLVARFLGVEEVPSSNLGIPSSFKALTSCEVRALKPFQHCRTSDARQVAISHKGKAMKQCVACKVELPESKFSRKGEGYQSRCKKCFAAYHRIYYQKNKALYMAKNRRNKNRQRTRLKAILLAVKQQPCQDCGGVFHPWVMELDHREGSIKLAAVGNLVGRGCTDERLCAEISKCDVVCANCHRMRTYHRRQRGVT